MTAIITQDTGPIAKNILLILAETDSNPLFQHQAAIKLQSIPNYTIAATPCHEKCISQFSTNANINGKPNKVPVCKVKTV